MNTLKVKIRFVFVPQIWLSLLFIASYEFLYWLLCIEVKAVNLKEDLLHFWIPYILSFVAVLLFLRPRVHLLQLDKNNGKIRGLYYFIAASITFVPTLLLLDFTDTASGQLTQLHSISEIQQKPATKYYRVNGFYYDKLHPGIEPVVSYSGRNNQDLNFDIYVATPMLKDSSDSGGSVPAFCFVHYHERHSNNLSKQERENKWKQFWEESMDHYDNDPLLFEYFEMPGNTDARDNAIAAAKNSEAFTPGTKVEVLKPVNAPFEERNGHKLNYALLSFGIGLTLWLIMVLIPGIHESKVRSFEGSRKNFVQKQLLASYQAIKPQKGFMGTWILTVTNILVFLMMVFSGLGVTGFYVRDLIPWGAVYKPRIETGEWWRLVTAMFLHGGLIHLALNMISLYICGVFLERLIGTKRFVIGYFIAGIAAGLISMWWYKDPIVAVGASGAIFGLYGILLSLILSRVFDSATNKMLLFLLACTAGYSLILGFLSAAVDNSAHVGGLIVGMLIGFVYMKTVFKNVHPNKTEL